MKQTNKTKQNKRMRERLQVDPEATEVRSHDDVSSKP